jgi:hypothetical protein
MVSSIAILIVLCNWLCANCYEDFLLIASFKLRVQVKVSVKELDELLEGYKQYIISWV